MQDQELQLEHTTYSNKCLYLSCNSLCRCSVSTGSPVVAPVIITPSDKKNSAAFAVSCKLTSDVTAWALITRIVLNYLYRQI
jgi:hypothetical protein